jgi:hypothetical protein
MERRQPYNKHHWENWISACRKLKLDPYLPSCTNINLKCIKNLNIRPETLKLEQGRVREYTGNL